MAQEDLAKLSEPINWSAAVAESGFAYKDAVVTEDDAQKSWSSHLERVFPTKAEKGTDPVASPLYEAKKKHMYVSIK